jgi:hypothetical protein
MRIDIKIFSIKNRNKNNSNKFAKKNRNRRNYLSVKKDIQNGSKEIK